MDCIQQVAGVTDYANLLAQNGEGYGLAQYDSNAGICTGCTNPRTKLCARVTVGRGGR